MRVSSCLSFGFKGIVVDLLLKLPPSVMAENLIALFTYSVTVKESMKVLNSKILIETQLRHIFLRLIPSYYLNISFYQESV